MTGLPRNDAVRELHAPFRPRLARVVAWWLAVAVLVFMVGLAVGLPVVAPGQVAAGDIAGIVGLGVLIAWFLSRQATVRATPDESGLVVRNLVVTRRVTWPEVVSVRFGQGRAWAQLDLADGETLAVMAIQAADGALGAVEAGRLATLVAVHSVTGADD